MTVNINGWLELVLGIAAAGAMVVGAYQGAKRQTAKGLAPLVGDPPTHSDIPLSTRLEELLRRLERQEERAVQAQRELADVRDDVSRNTRDIEISKELGRGHEERIGRLERRVDNVERSCGLRHRQDSRPPVLGEAP